MSMLEDWKSQKQAPPLFGKQTQQTTEGCFDRSIPLSHRAYNYVLRRLFFTTNEGYIGLAPIENKSGEFTSIYLVSVGHPRLNKL